MVARRQVPEHRKVAFYFGTALMVVGALLFLSTFVSFFANFGDLSNFNNFSQQAKTGAATALGGMILLGIGGFIRHVAARGAAGSGVVLDPEQAREDLEPYSRMAGGMVKDAIDEADISLGGRDDDAGERSREVVKVRCQGCRTLNDEDAKFCDECGKAL